MIAQRTHSSKQSVGPSRNASSGRGDSMSVEHELIDHAKAAVKGRAADVIRMAAVDGLDIDYLLTKLAGIYLDGRAAGIKEIRAIYSAEATS